jgi:hypothetical protein
VIIVLVANKVDQVEEDDRMKKYGRFKEKEPNLRRCFSDPDMSQQRSFRPQKEEFSAKNNQIPRRRDSLANGVRDSSPARSNSR